jgi:hypothetical protein
LKVTGLPTVEVSDTRVLTLHDDGSYTQSIQVGQGGIFETAGRWLFESGKLQLFQDSPLPSEMILLQELAISNMVGYAVIQTSWNDTISITVRDGVMRYNWKGKRTFRPGPNGTPLRVSVQTKLAGF